MSNETLSNLMHEVRRFEPPADLAADANLRVTGCISANAGLRRIGRKLILIQG